MMLTNIAQKHDSRAADLIMIVALLIAGFKLMYSLEHAVDIGLADESSYLYSGAALLQVGLPEAQNAPIYAIWYFILSLIEPDRIRLYFLNHKLVTVLPFVIVYIFLRRNSLPSVVSLIVAWSLLLSNVNIRAWPKVSHCALILTLLVLILVSHKRSFVWASCLAAIGALLISFVRPEYFLAYGVAILVFALALILEYKREGRVHIQSLGTTVLLSILLMAILGVPVGGDRSFVAFGQHFALNWVSWNGSDLNPWTNWVDIIFRNFGDIHNVVGALRSNPAMFLQHIGTNLVRSVGKSPFLVMPIVFFSDSTAEIYNDKFAVVVALLFVAGLCFSHIASVRVNLPRYRSLLVLLGIFLLPGIISVVLIYRREHYLLQPLVLTVVAVALLLSPRIAEDSEKHQLRVSQSVLLALLIVALTPSPYLRDSNAIQPNLTTIRFLESLEIRDPVNMLEEEGGYRYYLGTNYQRVSQYEKNTDFHYFLRMRDINMIVLSNRLLEDTRFREDETWYHFLANYADFGFVTMNIPNTDKKLYVQNDLLSNVEQDTDARSQ